MKAEKKLSGDADFWVFIAVDALIFSAAFIYLSYFRWVYPEVFFEGQSHLSPLGGGINTLVLLLSSFFMMSSVTLFRSGDLDKARKALHSVVALGALFVIIKVSEYGNILSSSEAKLDSMFLINYFAFTGLHLFHLMFGLVVLTFVGRNSEPSLEVVETTAVYWHFVDLVWVFLFLQLYLAG